MARTVVIAGSLAQRPGQGGHTWVFLQYLLGFKRLGWDVLFLDRLEPEMCFDRHGNTCPVEESINVKYFLEVMQRFGLRDSFALSFNHGERYIGLSREKVIDKVKEAELFLNVMGFFDDEGILGYASRRVFLDIDPGFGQMWFALGLADLFKGHNYHVTIGENIGRPGCSIPTCGLKWITTPQPIALDYWKAAPNGGKAFTSVASWRGPFGPIEYKGKTYGLRVHEFRKFAALPRLSTHHFQVALDIHQAETSDLQMLADNHWSLTEPKTVVADPWSYYAYIQQSKAELMVAKNLYVEAKSGWFSDRSICYLASGKPVLAQDTGIKELYPTGKGLLTFSTIEEAVAGAEEISANYAMHTRAARAIAEEYFDSDKVLTALLKKLSFA